MIEVTQIRKSYGKKKVLSDITFQVKPGECVAIAGKNGCGKSTLMQIMAGILKPDGGEKSSLQKQYISPVLRLCAAGKSVDGRTDSAG